MTTFAPEVAALYEYMSDISEDVYAAGWMAHCEWDLWAALTAWRRGERAVWARVDITDRMPRLDELSRTAGGWVWWPDHCDDAEFVPMERWLNLVEVRR